MNNSTFPKFLIISLVIIVFSGFAIQIFQPKGKKLDIRSKAAGGNIITVCPEQTTGCSYAGGDGIQAAIDAASNGDIVQLSGTFTRRNPTVDKKIKYERCMVDTRGKNITIKGPALLDGENGGYNYGAKDGDMIIGICDDGGDITIDSVQVKQTLRPAIYLHNSKAVLKNVSYLDIDNTIIESNSSNILVVNNLFAGSAGPAITVYGKSYADIENNTIVNNGFAAINLNICNNSQSSAIVKGNVIADPGGGIGIATDCKDQSQNPPNIKSLNNFVWKGTPGDCVKPSIPKAFDDCIGGELCTGVTVTYPYFIGADEEGTVCIWGEGRTAGDFNTRSDSPVTKAGAGYGQGPCSNPSSPECNNLVTQFRQQNTNTPSAAPTVYVVPSDNPSITPVQQNTPITNPTTPTGETIQPSQPQEQPTETKTQPTAAYVEPTATPIPPTPTITPTPTPIIDIKRTVKIVKTGINNLIDSFIQFTLSVLP